MAKKIGALFFSFMILTPHSLLAWGQKGHYLIADTAAQLLAETEEARFLRSNGFQLGYYANVPDLVWKKPSTYNLEWTNHFIDLEIFDRAFRASGIKDPLTVLSLNREQFDKKFPDLPQNAGRSYWRIRELFSKLKATTDLLKRSSPSAKDEIKKHHKLQLDWFVLTGVMSHYIGDLAMPLHVTENYDGQQTGQKGIHSHFEDTCVDSLGADLNVEVLSKVKNLWPKFKKDNSNKDLLNLLDGLAQMSAKEIQPLLKTDRSVERKNVSKSCLAFRKMIVNQLVQGTLFNAQIWSENLGWKYHGEKFYDFDGSPQFISPGQFE